MTHNQPHPLTFEPMPKLYRLRRDSIVTEKLDGTNAQICIGPDGEFLTGSRNRWVTPADDNYGFSRWAHEHRDELLTLGPGRHFGEWWGQGIQRGYGLSEKRFSLFNVSRWSNAAVRPECCHVVPVLRSGLVSTEDLDGDMVFLSRFGSVAAPGFLDPEGVVVYHTASGHSYKQTLGGDGHKGAR